MVAALNRSPTRALTVDGALIDGLAALHGETGGDRGAVPPLGVRIWTTPDLTPNR